MTYTYVKYIISILLTTLTESKSMTTKLKPDEQETIISMMGDNHDIWTITSDDPKWIKKLNKLTNNQGKQLPNSFAVKYTIDANQIVIRKKPTKKIITNEEKQIIGDRLSKSRTKKI